MIEATLVRESTPGETEILGELTIGNHKFATLELPWANNTGSRSCIPAGEYEISFKRHGSKPIFNRTYLFNEVPGRQGVLIHVGNTAEDTHGCILIGIEHGELNEKRAVLRSSDAMNMLRYLMGTQNFIITVEGGDASIV